MNEKKAERLTLHFRASIIKAYYQKIKLHYKNRDFKIVKELLQKISFDLVELRLRKQDNECKKIWQEMKNINLEEWRKD